MGVAECFPMFESIYQLALYELSYLCRSDRLAPSVVGKPAWSLVKQLTEPHCGVDIELTDTFHQLIL